MHTFAVQPILSPWTSRNIGPKTSDIIIIKTANKGDFTAQLLLQACVAQAHLAAPSGFNWENAGFIFQFK